MVITHLHTHSYYSFLEGLPSPEELAISAAREGMNALALTDHHYMSGMVEFYDACLGAGIRPILGLEIDVQLPEYLIGVLGGKSGKDGNHRLPGQILLVFLATDLVGWGNLCRLSSAVLAGVEIEEERIVPAENVLSFEKLVQHTSGLICLTGGRRGILAGWTGSGQEKAAINLVGQLADLFPGRLYAEIQLHSESDNLWVHSLAKIAHRFAVPLIATHDIFYIKQGQAELQKVASAIRQNRKLAGLESINTAPPDAYFIDQREMQRRFLEIPGALQSTQAVAEMCQLELPLGKLHFPELGLPEGITAIQELRNRAEAGAREIYSAVGNLDPTLQSRLDHELAVIEDCGYAPFFLVMDEIINFTRSQGIPYSSRGSAASSLVAHCLGITAPDPLRLNLYFERFLNPARASPPDIDTDLCSRRRDEVIRFAYECFGVERVAMVCTINRFRRRSALREVAKAYGLSGQEIKTLSDRLPWRWWGPPDAVQDNTSPFAELSQEYPSPQHQVIFRDAEAMLGIPHHLSVHPGGIVIAPGDINELVPVQLAPKGVVITQFDLESIERLGLVKLDLLGIRGLTVLGDVAGAIRDERSKEDHASNEVITTILRDIPDQDNATGEILRTGRTIGCFQIESPGMRATLREIQAHSVDDLMVALALYRPGPLTGGLKSAFVRRHLGKEPVEHLHPALGGLLDETYGVILYQEQVLRISSELAGFSLADADLLRRAMSHFDPGKQMQILKDKFVSGATQRSGVPEEVGDKIWDLMAAFAGYGFPKAHAASYAQVAWRSAWSKVHYPAVFMASVLANWGGYYGQRVYLTEARRLGLSVRPPHINYAQREFNLVYLEEKPALFMGLDQVRDLTRRTQERILTMRPFRSLRDFLVRVDPRPVEAENLVRAGGLEGFGTIPSMLKQLEHGLPEAGQLPLFDLAADTDNQLSEWSLEEQVAAQEEILGVGVAAHPLELVTEKITQAGAVTTLDATARIGEKVRVAGVKQTWRRVQSARGEPVYFMSLEDLDGMLDVVIFADVYRRSRWEIKGIGPIIVEGSVEKSADTGEALIRADSIWKV